MPRLSIIWGLFACAAICVTPFVVIPAVDILTKAIGCPIVEPETTCIVFGTDATDTKAGLVKGADALLWKAAGAAMFAIIFVILLFFKRALDAFGLWNNRPLVLFLGVATIAPAFVFALMAYVILLEEVAYGALVRTVFTNTVENAGADVEPDVYVWDEYITAEVRLARGGYLAFYPDGRQNLVAEPFAPYQVDEWEFHCPEDRGPLDGFEFRPGKFGPMSIVETIRRYDEVAAYVAREIADPDSKFLTSVKPHEVRESTSYGASRLVLDFEDDRCWAEAVPRC